MKVLPLHAHLTEHARVRAESQTVTVSFVRRLTCDNASETERPSEKIPAAFDIPERQWKFSTCLENVVYIYNPSIK